MLALIPPELVTLINLLAGIILLLVGGMVKVLWDAVKTLQADMNRLEVALPTVYMAKNEFRSEMKELKAMLEKISDKLDAKVDK